MRQNKDYLYKVKRSGCWWRHPLKEVVTKSCREITECGHVENARKKNTTLMNLKHLAEKIDMIQKHGMN